MKHETMKHETTKRLGKVVLCSALLVGGSAYSFDGDTLAFYPFCDGPLGSNGTSLTLTNAVDATAFSVTNYTDSAWAKAGLFFTNDVPGKYLFDGAGYHPEPLSTLFQAVQLGIRHNGAGGTAGTAMGGFGTSMNIIGLASELSKHDAWTVECFVNVPRAEDFVAAYRSLFSIDAGLTYSGADSTVVVYATGGTYSSKDWRVALGGTYAIIGTAPAAFNSGWMHVALVCTSTEIKLYVNYTQVSGAAAIGHAGENEGKNLVVNLSRSWAGHIAGLRVTKTALTPNQMLRASDCPTGEPAVKAQWPLEGPVGTQPTGENLLVVEYPDGNAPILAARKEGKVLEGGVNVRQTTSAVRLSGAEKGAAEDFAKGNSLRIPADSFTPILGDFTMEGYFKFDKKAWESKYLDGNTRRYVSVFSQEWKGDSTRRVWEFSFQRQSDGSYVPRIGAWKGDWNPLTDAKFGNAVNADGKWHHYALTYDHSQATFEFFEDGVSLGTHTFSDPIGLSVQGTAGNTGYRVGTYGASQPYEGLVDEVRLSQKVLAPSEFIKIDDRTGFIMSFY